LENTLTSLLKIGNLWSRFRIKVDVTWTTKNVNEPNRTRCRIECRNSQFPITIMVVLAFRKIDMLRDKWIFFNFISSTKDK
jgi:hypothetical protein